MPSTSLGERGWGRSFPVDDELQKDLIWTLISVTAFAWYINFTTLAHDIATYCKVKHERSTAPNDPGEINQ